MTGRYLQDVAQKYTADAVIERPTHVVMPGLINMHAHAAMSLFKAFSDDKVLIDWLRTSTIRRLFLEKDIWPAEAAFVGPEFCVDVPKQNCPHYQGTKLACAEMIRSGTTCYNDMYFAIEEAARTSVEIGIRAQHGLGVFGFPTSWAASPEECLKKDREFLEKFNNTNPLVTYAIAPHAPYTVPEKYLIEAKTLCEEKGVLMHMHVQECKAELDDSVTGKQSSSRHISDALCSPIEVGLDSQSDSQNLAAKGVLRDMLCAHCVHVTDKDIELLAANHATVLHNPTSNLKLASGIAPVQRMLDAGVNVCLGTDSACSNNNLDMFSEMRNAALVGKVAANDAQAMNAVTVLRMATLNAAKGLHLDQKIGSVEVGKEADLIAVDMDHVEVWPLANILSHLVYATGRDQYE